MQGDSEHYLLGLIHGGNGDDTIQSTYYGASTVYGDAGNDHIDGGGNVFGGTGNDTIRGFVVHGDAGNDHITADALAFGGAGNDTMDGWASSMDGGDGNDHILSSDAIVHGGNGDDVLENNGDLWGGYLYGDAGNDTLLGATSIDHHSEASTLFGGDGNDLIVGGGPDFVHGDAGNDTLEGSRVWGGSGTDTFLFRGIEHSDEYGVYFGGSSKVFDFQRGEDISLADAHKIVGYTPGTAVPATAPTRWNQCRHPISPSRATVATW